MASACDSSTKTEAGGLLQAQGQPGLQNETSLYFTEAKTKLFRELHFHKIAAYSDNKTRSRTSKLCWVGQHVPRIPASGTRRLGFHSFPSLKSKQKKQAVVYHIVRSYRRTFGFKHYCFLFVVFEFYINLLKFLCRQPCVPRLLWRSETPTEGGSSIYHVGRRPGIQTSSVSCGCLRSRGLQQCGAAVCSQSSLPWQPWQRSAKVSKPLPPSESCR